MLFKMASFIFCIFHVLTMYWKVVFLSQILVKMTEFDNDDKFLLIECVSPANRHNNTAVVNELRGALNQRKDFCLQRELRALARLRGSSRAK
jgi:hypothetical protein